MGRVISDTEFEKREKAAIRRLDWFQVQGCSWKGNTTPRNGKAVSCGHRHKTEAACVGCKKRMRRDRPGKCQDYRSVHIIALVYKKGAQP